MLDSKLSFCVITVNVWTHCTVWCWFKPVVPKLGVNYPTRVICDSSGGNAKLKPLCCSVFWAITAKEIFDLKCEKFWLEVIWQNRYLDLGNGSNKLGNHWFERLQTGLRLRDRNAIIATKWKRSYDSDRKSSSEWERFSCRKLPMDQYANCGTNLPKVCNFTNHEMSGKINAPVQCKTSDLFGNYSTTISVDVLCKLIGNFDVVQVALCFSRFIKKRGIVVLASSTLWKLCFSWMLTVWINASCPHTG